MIAMIALTSTVLLALAWVLSLTVLRNRPALRYAFLKANLLALILLPVGTLIAHRLDLASVRLAVLPREIGVVGVANQAKSHPFKAAEHGAALLSGAEIPRYVPQASLGSSGVLGSWHAPASVPRVRAVGYGSTGSSGHSQGLGADAASLAGLSRAPVSLARLGNSGASSSSQGAASPWVVLAGVLYVFGAALILARYAKSSRSLTAATRAAQPIAGTKLEAVVESLRKRIGVRRFPTVLLSEEVDTPLAFGMRQPVILIPTEMAEEASVCDLESILLHEYAHLDQRHDISVWLSVLAKAMYWPNPLVHRATFELCRAREEVSDNYVLRVLPATQLARALLSVAQSRARFVPQPAAAGLMLPKWNLERRVAGLLDPTRNCETHATRFNMTAFNLTAATLCATLAGLQLVHAQDATVRVKQGNHTYTLRSTAKHPVTIQVRGKDGKVSTIVIEGRANRVRKRGGVTYFVNGDGGERYMVRTRTPEPPTPPMLERDAVPPIPPMPEDFEVARPGSPAAPPAPPLRSDDDYFQVAPPAMPGDATPVPPEPPEAAAPDTVIVGRGPDKTIVRQDIVVDGGPLAIVQADPVIKDDAVFQVRGNKDAPTTEEHRREIEALRKQKLRAAYEAGQRAGDSVKREMASQSEGTMTRANAEAMKKAFAAEREAMRNMMAADSVKREMASQSEGTMTRANAETMKKAFAAEREAMRKAMAAERESQRDIMGKAVRIRTDEMARAQKDLARAAADEGGHRSLHQLLEQAAREAEANGNKKAAEQIRNLIGQLSK